MDTCELNAYNMCVCLCEKFSSSCTSRNRAVSFSLVFLLCQVSNTHSLSVTEWVNECVYNDSYVVQQALALWVKWKMNWQLFIYSDILAVWLKYFILTREHASFLTVSLSLYRCKVVFACVRATKHTNTFNPRFDIISVHTPKPFTLAKQTNLTNTHPHKHILY